jgi:hypothetical protein
MNERIRELAEQAKFTWVENDKDITGGVDLEKFAELIVRECMDNLAWHGHDEAVSQLEWFKVNKLGIK